MFSKGNMKIAYSSGTCITYCIGIQEGSSTMPFSFERGNCGELCCKTSYSYCVDSNGEIIESGPFNSTVGTEVCSDFESSIDTDCPTEGFENVTWVSTTECSDSVINCN